MATKTKPVTPPDYELVQSSTPQELTPAETMGAVVAEAGGATPAAAEFAQTAPTSESGHETPDSIPSIIQHWVDETHKWLWRTPRQALLHGDYDTFLAELKKTL